MGPSREFGTDKVYEELWRNHFVLDNEIDLVNKGTNLGHVRFAVECPEILKNSFDEGPFAAYIVCARRRRTFGSGRRWRSDRGSWLSSRICCEIGENFVLSLFGERDCRNRDLG